MNYFRISVTIMIVYLLAFFYIAVAVESRLLLSMMFFGTPFPVIFMVYAVLRGKPSEYELKDGWYENL